jgi:hypothetical protein
MDLSNMTWRKSSYSNSNGGACVEIGTGGPAVAVRDSKNPDGPKLVLRPDEWRSFLADVKSGEFDLS